MARTEQPTQQTWPSRVLVAAAKIVRRGRGSTGPKKADEWQRDAWEFFDAIGEVKQATYFLANVVSMVRLYVGIQPEPEQEPMPAPAGTTGAAEAEQALERLRVGSVYGGLGGLLAEFVVNLKVAGECYLLGEYERRGRPDATTPAARASTPERWDVRSVDEVEVKSKEEVLIHDLPGDKGRRLLIPEVDQVEGDRPEDEWAMLVRVWQRHPRFSELADSSLRAVLAECDELLILSRAIRGAARSRLAGAGVWYVPNELSFGSEEVTEGQGDAKDPFLKELTDAMTTAITDESDATGVVPIVIRGPAEYADKLPHIKFERPLDGIAGQQRRELIERLGHSLDIPVEQLTGLANVNHWTAWQIDGASWARYGHPTTRLICEAITEGYLWPMLEEAGIDPAIARRLIVWFDPADAIVDPDISKSADEGFDRGSISWQAHRRYKGFSEDDAPSPDELDERAQLGLLRGSSGRPVSPGGQGPPADGEPPSSPDAQIRSVVAARRQPLGRRLMEIDRSLRLRLNEVAEVALRRALERAGSRVRTRAQRDANVSAALDRVPAHLICSHLGPAIIAGMGLTEDELLAAGIDEVEPRFETRVAQSQRQTRRELQAEFDLSDAEMAELERRQDEDRQEAWAWFAGALLALGRERLYDPSPAAPTVGEFDASASVPARTVREAMALAGGGLPGDGVPAGGVATGNLVLDVWARHGQVVAGWEWVYGDASSRTNPFPAHEDLDGAQFATWDDPILSVRGEDAWLGVTHYRPSDHDWCQCDFIPMMMADVEVSQPEEASV